MKKIISIFAIFVLVAGAGCKKDFAEINENPNAPNLVANPGLLLPQVIRGSVNASFDNSYTRGSIAANLLVSDYASNFTNWARSDAPSYFFWSYYDYIRDLNEVIKLSEEQSLDNYKGVALVLRSWMFQFLTDMYGPIPFRDAANAKLQGIYKPAYEEQQAVYEGILGDLEEANSLLGTGEETIVGDILYSGDISKWKKFANGLSLRLLLRQSKRVDPSAAMRKIVTDPVRYPLFDSHEDQAALQYSGERQENESPFYRSGNAGTNTKVSKQLVDYLESLNDKRLLAYALPTPASSGAGKTPDDFEYEGNLNGIGTLPDDNNHSPSGMLWMSIQYNPTLASPTAPQGIIISYSEVQFILAEAAEKGMIDGGSAAAEVYYKNGIADQFDYYSSRIPSNYASSYLGLEPGDIYADENYYIQPGVSFIGNTQQKLEKIWLQKWISLYMVGFEAWSEWRRTGFPEIPVGPVGPGFIPRRTLYPIDEMSINEVNYLQAVNWLGADDLQSHVWWDQ